ncbi:hypothetical protein ANN_12948 [Periplaneta americana]|uniref:Uncharacterized protein n=1 Tax=Periplaneta americana TaxID=6978 RepID=A0ABQ8TK59_PERAM|nr:hypothetical protein ANN_12948 [Periplaneta americana]
MSSNIVAVRVIPGRCPSTIRCHHTDCSENEILGHVLGFCRKGEVLRNSRHHKYQFGSVYNERRGENKLNASPRFWFVIG